MTVSFSKAMQGYGNDFIKEMFAAARNPDMISFAGGAPAPEVYPLDAFRAASDKAFEEWGRTMMAYDGAEGVLPLREIIAGERMASMGVECTAADIRVLSGSQNGIDFIARTYLDEGDTIAFMQSINAIRLVLGSMLGITDDDSADALRALVDDVRVALVPPASPGGRLLWQIGKADNDTRELALGRHDWNTEALAHSLDQVDRLEREVQHVSVPLPYADQLEAVCYRGGMSG